MSDLRATQIGRWVSGGKMSPDAVRAISYNLTEQERDGDLEIFISREIDEYAKGGVAIQGAAGAGQDDQPAKPINDCPSAELTFERFHRANVARCLKWHPLGINSWSASDWLTAVTGELGELASLLKMRNRERDGFKGNKFSPTDKQISDELADVFTYLDLLAEALGVDLARAVVDKFNEVSARVGFPYRIELAGVDKEPDLAKLRRGLVLAANHISNRASSPVDRKVYQEIKTLLEENQ